MASRWRHALWLLPPAALAFALLTPPDRVEIDIIGDGAAAVKAAFAPLAADIDARIGAVDAVLLRRMENLRHIPEVARLCRGRCDGALTILYEIRPGGGRKVLVFDLARFPGAAIMDQGAGLPGPIATCIARAIAAETGRVGPGPPSPCLGARRWRVVLPYGL
ncbi:hypothetical protein MWU52_10740 [Jannaschia sp. S6380]|uniref:hypothetical protein n=1 Tax=Jannaschia sp. S6380 TaxID=2926408 RepID=UPI001FF5CA91|nr:hypothetical protein [Jannaschia sp. S6380]MCK0168028.1 hypothetical protein [Jannaschia sp. S6380]